MEHNRHRSAEYRRSSGGGSEEVQSGRQYGENSRDSSGRRIQSRGEPSSEASRKKSAPDRGEHSSRRSSQRKAPDRDGASKEGKTKAKPSGERKREKPSAPSERSVKAAKKREALRAENARLHRLRQRQKRKAKRRTVKRINKGLFKRMIIMAGVVVAVVLTMIIFFRVEHIQVEGNSYYSQEEVLQVCGVATGDNLLTLSRGKISGSIMAPLKYIESVKVSRQLPNTVIIHVTESRPRYAVQDSAGDFYLMTAQGKIVEQISPGSAKEYTMIQELIILPPTIGEEIQIHGSQEDGTKAKGQLTAMQTLLAGIEDAALGRHIASVQIPSSFKISLWYEDRFQVELGNTTRMDYKLEYLKAVVAQQESYVTGTIDLTLRDGDKAILLPED